MEINKEKDSIEDLKAIIYLDYILKQARKKKRLILERAKHGRNIFDLDRDYLKEILNEEELSRFDKRASINIEERWNYLINRNIKFTYYGALDYPEKLLNIPDPPFVLYYLGELPQKNSPSVAIIGARQNSEYGSTMAKHFAKKFAENNIEVISGMAMGIDGISQREAIKNGGKSYAVLGSGVDVIYPNSNKELYQDLLTKGGVISEYFPGTKAIAENFPPRNRIISGLADCVLVVEARQKSGTLITVDMALDQGRDVFVIPGRCTDALSFGCNKLIKNGAICACTPEDVMQDMHWIEESESKIKRKRLPKVSDAAKEIYKVLDFNPKSQDEIFMSLKLRGIFISMSELMQGLLELELKGIVQRNFGQYSVTVSGF